MCRIELDYPPVLDDQRHRPVAHPLKEPRHFGHQRLQVVGSGRIEAGREHLPAGCAAGDIDEIDRLREWPPARRVSRSALAREATRWRRRTLKRYGPARIRLEVCGARTMAVQDGEHSALAARAG